MGLAANPALRLLLLRRKSNPGWPGLWLHPVGAAMVLAINAWALAGHLAGRPRVWRGRRCARANTPGRAASP